MLRERIEKHMIHTPIVLVIEDDLYISKLIAVLLEEAYYQALIAGSAAEGFALIEQHNPDLVNLDWMLPDLPGDQVCR